MLRNQIRPLVTFCSLLLVPAMAQAETPTSRKLTFSGSIPGQDDGPVPLQLRVYDASADGTLLFEETQTVEVVSEGFTTLLGNGTEEGVPPDIFQNPSAWIAFALEVNPKIEIGTRTPITSSGYAHFSALASNASFSPFAASATNTVTADTAGLALDATLLGGVSSSHYPLNNNEIVRIVRGFVGEDGHIIEGQGFSARLIAADGEYVITFSPPFPRAPAVTGHVDNGLGDVRYGIISTAGVTGNTANIRTFRGQPTSGPVAANAPFYFTAIGPR